jgi:predicted ATP-grasp superfamily ATP-dependent carboligase
VHVLVTDGEQRAALAAVRSLGGAGHHVAVTSSRPHSLAGASRYAALHVQVPPPGGAPHEYAQAIAALVRQRKIELVLPITDESLLSLLEPSVRDALSASIPFPSLNAVLAIADKQHVTEVAASVGLAVPRQWTIEKRQVEAPAEVSFPVVVKPHRSVVEASGANKRLRVDYAETPAALRTKLRALPTQAFPVLLQERVTGPGVGVFLLRWGGRVVAAFGHRRIREKPPAGGVSVYRESLALDDDLLARTERLLEAFDWNGVAMVEYKLDAKTGTPYVMEINGRLWGSLQLAVDAGVDFPVLLIEAARGLPAQAPRAYRVGVRSRWFWGDVDHLLARMRRSRAALSLPADAPGRLRTVRDFLAACLRPAEEEVLRWSDPKPFVRETLDWFRGR